jgi:RNA polymerase sigma-70 factor (ECF subfamily)
MLLFSWSALILSITWTAAGAAQPPAFCEQRGLLLLSQPGSRSRTMDESEADAAHRVPRGQEKLRQVRDQMLEAFRGYLLTIAQKELAPHLRGASGASDLVQETFAAAHEHLAQFRGTTAAELRGWLRRILRNKLADLRRRGGKISAPPRIGPSGDEGSALDWTAGLIAPGPSPSDVLSRTEEARIVHEILNRLPENYRRVILCRLEENLSFEEIGRRLGISANAAEKLFTRAVSKVRRLLEAR